MEEFLDIVDENDNVIGRDTRENIWKKGLQQKVRGVNIFIFNKEGKLLLPKRSMNREIFPGCFDFSCGGYVRSGEDYYEAAIRELKEELDLENIKLVEIGKLTPKDGVSCFLKIYQTIYDGKIRNYDKSGIDKLFWIDLDKVEEMIEKDKNKFKEDFPIVLNWYRKIFKNPWLEKEIRL